MRFFFFPPFISKATGFALQDNYQEMSGLSQFIWEPQRGEEIVITECIKTRPDVPKSKGQGSSLSLQLAHCAKQDAEDSS